MASHKAVVLFVLLFVAESLTRPSTNELNNNNNQPTPPDPECQPPTGKFIKTYISQNNKFDVGDIEKQRELVS